MIVTLDYNASFDSFINDRTGKMLGNFYTALDEQKNKPDLDMPTFIKENLDEAARTNTEPMQDIIGVIINKSDFTYDNATVEDVRTLTDCIFEHSSPFVFKDDVNEQNYKTILGYISGKLAMDLAAKHYEYSDGIGTNQYHIPIGIVQAKTNEPLVFDSSAYTKKPEKPGLNIFKYIFSSEYRQKYKLDNKNYKDSLKAYEAMNNRTAYTMGFSAECSSKYRHHAIKDDKHLQTQTMGTAKLGISMLADEAERSIAPRSNSEENENTRTRMEGGFDALNKEEFGENRERKTAAVKEDPAISKAMSMND